MKLTLHLDWKREQALFGALGRSRGYDEIKRRLAANSGEPLAMHAFSYAFLRSAKNVDLLVCADASEIQDELASLRHAVTALERFERDGDALAGDSQVLKEPYLRIRQVVMRPSTRDECRALALWLMSGPASASELVEALELSSENLARRIAAALRPLVELREDRFWIHEDLMPVALFAVRERMGIDPLSALPCD